MLLGPRKDVVNQLNKDRTKVGHGAVLAFYIVIPSKTNCRNDEQGLRVTNIYLFSSAHTNTTTTTKKRRA